ncbi:hypothetical protein [Pseudomonas zhanjiangensis]|uniref:Lipoprotein n=1 Tax=Pseudomonas zhanjiangensis TaxID=3239015 RepID=A0ABV3YZF9_9PSED
MTIKLASATVALISLSGCVTNYIPLPGESRIDYKGTVVGYHQPSFGTLFYANKQSQDLSLHKDQTAMVMALHGYPSLQAMPQGHFTVAAANGASAEHAEMYRNMPPATTVATAMQYGKSISGNLADLAVGQGGMSTLALAGALAGPDNSQKDPRYSFSSILCFKTVEGYDADRAIRACWDDIENSITALPQYREPVEITRTWNVFLKVPTPKGEEGRVQALLQRSQAEYVKGFAPKQLGGYPAHIFSVQVSFRTPKDETTRTTPEQLSKVLASKKPTNLVYLITENPKWSFTGIGVPAGLVF